MVQKVDVQEDFSANSVFIEDKYVFIHELGHVWQHQHGQWVRMRELLAGLLNIPTGWIKKSSLIILLNSKPILADYWLLLVYGISKWSYYQRPGRMGMYRGVDLLQDVPSLYQKIVTGKGR
jgi:hypothetical protein